MIPQVFGRAWDPPDPKNLLRYPSNRFSNHATSLAYFFAESGSPKNGPVHGCSSSFWLSLRRWDFARQRGSFHAFFHHEWQQTVYWTIFRPYWQVQRRSAVMTKKNKIREKNYFNKRHTDILLNSFLFKVGYDISLICTAYSLTTQERKRQITVQAKHSYLMIPGALQYHENSVALRSSSFRHHFCPKPRFSSL